MRYCVVYGYKQLMDEGRNMLPEARYMQGSPGDPRLESTGDHRLESTGDLRLEIPEQISLDVQQECCLSNGSSTIYQKLGCT